MATVPIDRSALPSVIAALQHYAGHLIQERQRKPFDMGLLAELHRNHAAVLAVRDALQDYHPTIQEK